jgi:hypothetical protein
MKKMLLVTVTTMLSLPVLAGVQVKYLDGPSEKADTINVRNLQAVQERNTAKEAAYQEKIKAFSDNDAAKKQHIAELTAELNAVKKEKAHIVEKTRKIVSSAREAELAKKRKDALERNTDYDLVVDNTQKIISYIGTPPESLPAVNSEGDDAPLKHAFASLVPLDWQLYLSKEINKENPTQWDANGDNWLKGLYEIGTSYGYQYTVNWIDRWVLVNKSSLRLGGKDIIEPTIRVKGLKVEAGQKGYILIDGRVIEVESVRK